MTHRNTEEEHDPLAGDGTVGRREFVRLSVATAGALSLPGNAAAELSAPELTDRYQYVTNHTPPDGEVQTLVEFSSAAGLEALETLGIESQQTTEPAVAAYTQLTTPQVEQVADLPTAERLSHSPGANPFWRLGFYPLGVFPDPKRSTGFIDYEEMIAGLNYLEREHPDRLRFYSIGKSPGHLNYLTDRTDPKGVYVAEVTNDIQDEAAFREKQKVLFSLSIHGLERAGVEGGSRFIENLLEGREHTIEQLLDDLVLLFVYPNPDGWVAKHPQYDSAWQAGGGTQGIPAGPFYERGNAEVGDLNREFPTVGWINPSITPFPAEPNGRNLEDDDPGIDADVPTDVMNHVSDILATVDHFRDYENLTHGADLHGAIQSEFFVFGLLSKAQYDHGEFHDAYEMHRVIDERLEDALELWNTVGDVQRAVTGDTNPSPVFRNLGVLPGEAYEYATIWDLIGQIRTGVFGDWMAYPRDQGGLGLTSVDFEMAYSHMVGANVYNPELVDMQVTGYTTAIRTVSEYATRDVEATVETAGDDTAYVTTDRLTRTSEDLSFMDETSDGGTTETTRTTETVALDSGGVETVSAAVPAATESLTVTARPRPGTAATVDLLNPDGDVVATTDSTADQYDDITWVVTDPDVGGWTVRLSDMGEGVAGEVDVGIGTLQSTEQNPDPVEALGYEQREYETTPLRYFEEYAEFADASIDPVSIDDVAEGDLAYDNLVVIHDDGIDDPAYVAALEKFVDQGGNLVLTDTGVRLLGEMDADLTSDVSPDDISRATFVTANLADKNLDHELLEGARPIQRELYKATPLGYAGSELPPNPQLITTAEAPMTLVDEDAFTDAGGTVAGRSKDRVAAGSIYADDDATTGVHVIGGLLPPGDQSNLHPFGLRHYAVSFLGHTMLTNALTYRQRRFVDGELRVEFGDID